MFGVDTSELLLIAIVALIFIGPKDLPQALRSAGRMIGKVRAMARHFHTGVEAMMREAELEELETKWREENERIMREYPALPNDSGASPDEPPLPLGDTPPAPRPPDERELP